VSYILDALKKSERERALENISTLSPVMPTQIRSETRWSRWWLGFGVLALMGVLLWKYQTPLQQNAFYYLRDAKNVVSSINLSGLFDKSEKIKEEPKEVAEIPNKAVENPEPDEVKQVRQSVAPTVEEKVVTSTIGVGEPKTESMPTVASVENDSEVVPQPATQSSNTQVTEAEKESEILSLNLAPQAVRQKLSALTLAAVSYTKDAERRFVLVNDQMYREGDGLPGGAIIEKITRDGMIVAANDVKVLLRP